MYTHIDAVLEAQELVVCEESAQAFLADAPALYSYITAYDSPLPDDVLQLLSHLKAASERAFPQGLRSLSRGQQACWACTTSVVNSYVNEHTGSDAEEEDGHVETGAAGENVAGAYITACYLSQLTADCAAERASCCPV